MVNIFSIFKKKPNVLVIVGGNKSKIEPFLEAGANLNVPVTIASFSELTFDSIEPEPILKVQGRDLREFTAIYIRMVGKRLEDVTLVANYARKHGIKLLDSLYEDAHLMPSSLGKSIELMKLIEANVALPKTFFGSVAEIERVGPKLLGFPLVVKSTTGKKAREVWCPETKPLFKQLMMKLSEKEKEGMRFFAQEFIPASERVRVFVLGGKALAAIVRPSKWRKRVGSDDGRKMALKPIPALDSRLSIIASKAVSLDIAGVDIVHNAKTGEAYILEVNAAPSWKALAKDTGLFIEEEILKYLINK